MNNKVEIGSVSSGTMRDQDLIPTFVDHLLWLDSDNGLSKSIQEKLDDENFDAVNYYSTEECTWDLDELFEELDKFSLPFTYFGANEGDGSDYGFWVYWDWVNDDEDEDAFHVNDLGDVLDDYSGLVMLHTSTYKASLYKMDDNNNLIEIWSVE
jgi:hypothetical protein